MRAQHAASSGRTPAVEFTSIANTDERLQGRPPDTAGSKGNGAVDHRKSSFQSACFADAFACRV